MSWRVLRVATISLWGIFLLASGDLELANAVIIVLILLMKEMGIPDYLICLLRNLYASQEATVRT